MLDHETCYRAVSSRDARFDGWFVTAVTTTGIYCRPSCPATTPKRRNVTFHPTAAAAQLAGFRACRRCRPDASPGSPEWNVRSDTVARAMRLIGDGAVDRHGVAGLATRLGYSERQLHRLLVAEVGAGAQALARAQRAHTARVLVETTDLRFAEVAFAAGFASIRQFNDTVRAVFATTPRDLRTTAARRGLVTPGTMVLRLATRRPFDGRWLLDLLASKSVPGVESYDGTTFRRALLLPHGEATVDLTPGRRPCRWRPCGCRTRATWCQQSPGSGGCSTSTPTRPPSTRRCPADPLLAPWSAPGRASGCPARSTAPRWPSRP